MGLKPGKKELEHESSVVQMAMKGMPDKDIAKSLGITVTQVYKLRRRDAEQFAKKVRGMTPYDVINQISEFARQRIIRLWSLYENATDQRVKNLTIRSLQKEEELFIERNQLLGILPRESVEFTMVQNNDNRQVTIQATNVYDTLKQIALKDQEIRKEIKEKSEAIDAEVIEQEKKKNDPVL